MEPASLFAVFTLLFGWLLGRFTAFVEKNYERRASRNRLIFHLLELYEDIAKRKISDELVIARSGSQVDLQAYRAEVRRAIPDEADQSSEHFHEMIRATAEYDPLLAQEISFALLPAKLLDKRLQEGKFDKDEFQLFLGLLGHLDRAIMKRIELICVDLAKRNGPFFKRKISGYFRTRSAGIKDGIELQRKLHTKQNETKE